MVTLQIKQEIIVPRNDLKKITKLSREFWLKFLTLYNEGLSKSFPERQAMTGAVASTSLIRI